MANLPDSVFKYVERTPVEDFLLAILRKKFPDIKVTASYETPQEIPAILIRRDPAFGLFREDIRWIDNARINIQCLAEDPNGDQDAALLSEAVRVALRQAWLDQEVIPGMGHMSWFVVKQSARKANDWATATGPVQFADLPVGLYRYETIAEIELRLPPQKLRNFHY